MQHYVTIVLSCNLNACLILKQLTSEEAASTQLIQTMFVFQQIFSEKGTIIHI